MSSSCCCGNKARIAAYFVGIAGTLLIVGALAWLIIQKTRPVGVDQARVELRTKNLAEMRALDKAALETYGWVDQTKGLVRLPVDRAMEMTIALWQNPSAARSNLLGRIEKATAKPPREAESIRVGPAR